MLYIWYVDTRKTYRSIFISDTHLGTRACQADRLHSFLKHNTSNALYLVGDIIDGWSLRRSYYWPQTHTDVIRKILTAARRGTEVYYIAGNHDEFLRKYIAADLTFGRIHFVNRRTHIAVNGERFLVLHGDLFDNLMRSRSGKLAMHLGGAVYDSLVRASFWLNRLRSFFRLKPWSLSKFVKEKTKTALNHIYHFEDQVAHYATEKGFDGVICGHIHTAAIKQIGEVKYLNSGDWVESCSALVEHHDGSFEIINWE